MYSHIARKRQESNMRELKAEVESLSVYRLMIEEAPDMIAVLSPDIESRFLFANGAFARVLHVTPASILGRWVTTTRLDGHISIMQASHRDSHQ